MRRWAGGPGYVVGLGWVGLGRWTWLRRWAIPYGPDPPRTGVAAISRTPPSRSVPLAGGVVRAEAGYPMGPHPARQVVHRSYRAEASSLASALYAARVTLHCLI